LRYHGSLVGDSTWSMGVSPFFCGRNVNQKIRDKFGERPKKQSPRLSRCADETAYLKSYEKINSVLIDEKKKWVPDKGVTLRGKGVRKTSRTLTNLRVV